MPAAARWATKVRMTSGVRFLRRLDGEDKELDIICNMPYFTCCVNLWRRLP